MWYIVPDRYAIKPSEWNDYLHVMSTFDTVHDMWATLNAAGRATQLPKGSRFYVFKKGVKPLWEDRQNEGGRLISIEHSIGNARKAKIADRWIDVVLAVLGESMARSDLVNGVEFTVRKETYNICLWTCPCDDAAALVIQQEVARLVNWKSQVKVSMIITNSGSGGASE
jgi:translation initiation factor 4E